MEVQDILTTLQQRGATVRVLDGGRLEVIPRRVLDDELRAAIRAHKVEVLAELRQATRAKFDLATVARARASFAARGIDPSAGALKGAATLEQWIADGGPPRRGLSIGDLQGWLEEIYAGRASGRLLDDGRVVLRPRYNPADAAVRPLEVAP